MGFPRIGFKGFPVFNSWIVFLYPRSFRAFLFLVVDTAYPQSMLRGKAVSPPTESEILADERSLRPLLCSQLAAWQEVSSAIRSAQHLLPSGEGTDLPLLRTAGLCALSLRGQGGV